MISHSYWGYKPYTRVGMLVEHLGGLLRNQGTLHHIRICHHSLHLITSHLNSLTLQVGSIGHPSIFLLLILLSSSIGHRGGRDSTTHSQHLSLHLIILILSIQLIPKIFYEDLFLQSPLLHNNLIISRI